MLKTLFNWLLLNELYLPLGHNIKLILLYYVFCFYLSVLLIKCCDWFINKHIIEFRITLDVPIFLTTSDMFGSILLYVNPKDMFLLLLFFSLFQKILFRSMTELCPFVYLNYFHYIFIPNVFVITALFVWYSSSIELQFLISTFGCMRYYF